MKKSIICFFMMLIIGIVSFGKTATETGTAGAEHVIPFELKDYVIVVQCRINDSQDVYRFVVDTGALMFIDKTLADQLQLKQQGNMAKISNLVMGDFDCGNVFAFTNFDLSQFKKTYGLEIHGLIGSNFLERFTVTLDYSKQRMTLSTNKTSLSVLRKNNKGGYLLKFTKHPINNAPVISCQLNDNINVQAMIDTGQPYPLVLPLNFLEKMGILEQKGVHKAKGSIVKWPGTTSMDNYLARTKLFQVSGFRKNNLITVYAELPPVLSMPLLGADFLSQFLIIIDYPNSEILLQPKKKTPRKSNLYSTGLQLVENDQHEIVVRGVWEKSPADQMGIQVDDEVLEFNAIKLTPETYEHLWLLLTDEKITEIELLIKNKKGQHKVKIKKAHLLK